MKHQILNPFLPLYEYIPDGEPHIFDGRLYLYGSHDYALGKKGFCPGDYMSYSCPVDDLSDWTCHGVLYAKKDDPYLTEDDSMAAPDVVKGIDGRYYLYFNSNARMACHIGVSDTPQGPFAFYSLMVNKDGTPYEKYKCFDPGVLVDNGHVYIYFGFCMKGPVPERFKGKNSPFPPSSFAFELKSDMKTIKSGPYFLIPGGNDTEGTGFEEHGFYEASSPRKIHDQYVLTYSSEKSHDLAYAIADEPFGPFTYKGVLISNCNIGYQGNTKPQMPYGNTHGGLVEVDGEWYVFYHRQTDGQEASRQACAEKLQLDNDGWFLQAEMTTTGLNDAPLKTRGEYNATYCCYMVSSELSGKRYTVRECVRNSEPHIHQEDIDGDETHSLHYIANVQKDITLGYKYFDFINVETINLTLRGEGNANIRICLDENGLACIGELHAPIQKDWTTVTIPVQNVAGVHPLYFLITVETKTDILSFAFVECEDAS